MLHAFGCVNSHIALDGLNIENPDVIPDMNSGVMQDFQRQDMPDLAEDLLEFRRMQGPPVDCVDQIYLGNWIRGIQGGLRGRLRFGLDADGLDHRTHQGFTVHLQSRRKALITHESQKFSQTSITTVIPFHDSSIDPHPSTTVTTSTPLHLPSFSLSNVDVFNLHAGNALSLVWLGDSEGSDVNWRCRVSGKSSNTGSSSA